MNREKVIKALQSCSVQNDVGCQGCPYLEERKTYGHEWCTTSMAQDTLALLKEQDKRYAMMVVDWLRDMAHNNYLDLSHMMLWDAILDIRERAQTGLENYFRDYDAIS
jgi:hypothetical protein